MVLAELQRDPKKRKKAFTEEDFMPGGGEKKSADPERLLRVVHTLHLLYTAEDGVE